MADTEKEIHTEKSQETHHHSHHSHHHHHHHHHSHQRRSHHSNKTGSKNKFKRFLRKNKKRLSYIAVIVLLLLVLILLAALLDFKKGYNNSGKDTENVIITNNSIQIEIPFYTKNVSLVSPVVEEYLKSDSVSSADNFYEKYKKNGGRADIGEPLDFCYRIKGIPEGYSVNGSKILLSEKPSIENPVVYELEGSANQIYIYNLKTNTQYYYRVELTLSDGSVTSAQGAFKTADTPRMLKVDGIVNVRDIGGWKTKSGETVRQGLLFRGSELDGAVESKFYITKGGIKTLVNELKISTEMDLRPSSDNKEDIHPLGNNVRHIYYGVQMYTGSFENQGAAAIKKVFSDLAVSSNYPVYMHCTYGMDRTGTVCYLLGALLGVDKQDLMRDYQLSAFYYGETNDNQMNEFIAQLDTYSGNTLQEKTENYLLSIGVTQQEIESIRNIFLG